MAKNKIGLEFKGFDEVIANFEHAGGNIKQATEAALKASKQAVTPGARAAILRHRRTGRTEASLDTNMNVDWDGLTAEINIGFNIKEGGLASIFLMYGTPRIMPDKTLYNSIYGPRISKEIAKIQEDAINKVISRTIGG